MAKSGTDGGRFNSRLFKDRVAQLDQKKADIGELRGEVSQVWKFVEDHGGNKRAMRDAMKIRDMPDGTRNDYLAFLKTYCEWLDVFAQGDLFGDQPGVPTGPVKAAAEAPLLPPEETATVDGGPEVITVDQLDEAEAEGYKWAVEDRDLRFVVHEAGSIMRAAFDKGYQKRQLETGGSPEPEPEPEPEEDLPSRRRGRPPGSSRVARGLRAVPTTGRGRGSRRTGSQPTAAE